MSEPTQLPDLAASTTQRRRIWLLAPVVPIVVAVIGFFVFLTDDQPEATPVLESEPVGLVSMDDVSDDELEGLLDTYRNDSAFADEIPGVTLLLAERYFTVAAYDRAFALYAEVIENTNARPKQFALALSRISWIGWLTNGDTAAALTNLDRALSIDPDNSETAYIKGQILWCGAGRADAAIVLFDQVLSAPDLTEEVRAQVSDDLAAARADQPC